MVGKREGGGGGGLEVANLTHFVSVDGPFGHDHTDHVRPTQSRHNEALAAYTVQGLPCPIRCAVDANRNHA